MKKILLLLFFVSLSSYSQNWIYTSKDKFGNKYYIKNKAVSVNDGVVKIWTKRTTWKVTHNNKDYLNCYMVVLYEYDCNNDKIRQLSFTIYNSKGGVIASGGDSDFAEWDYVVPDSVEESRIKKTCEMFNN